MTYEEARKALELLEAIHSVRVDSFHAFVQLIRIHLGQTRDEVAKRLDVPVEYLEMLERAEFSKGTSAFAEALRTKMRSQNLQQALAFENFSVLWSACRRRRDEEKGRRAAIQALAEKLLLEKVRSGPVGQLEDATTTIAKLFELAAAFVAKKEADTQ